MSKLLSTTDIGARFGVSSATIHNRIADGSFPKPDETNGRKRYWTVATVNAWKAKNRDLLKTMTRRSGSRVKAKSKKKKAA